MKATGVVRRIDELGRIVIPKELRRTLRIKEGDLIEIYIDDASSIILKKHSIVENCEEFIIQITKSINYATKKNIFIVDNEKVIATSGNIKSELVGRKIDLKLSDMIQKRKIQIFDQGEFVEVCNGFVVSDDLVFKPIVVYGDVIGACFLVSNKLVEADVEIVEIISSFIGKYLES